MQNSNSFATQGAPARALARFCVPQTPCALAVVTLAALCAAPMAAAQERTLASTVVTATRSAQLLDETLADVRVISQAQIDSASGRSLAEILQRFGGVQMASNGGRGNMQSVYIRGNKNVIVLIDGVRYGSATMGVSTLESLPIEAIERIEVVQGPASALYGSDAVGGVIQIFTKQGRGAQQVLVPNAAVTWGRAGYKKATGGLSGAQGGWNYSVQAARVVEPGFSATNAKSSDFHADTDKFHQNSINAALAYAFNADWRVDVNLMRSDTYAEYDLGYFYDEATGNFPLVKDSYNDLRAATSQLKLSGKLASNWTSTLSVARSQDSQRGHHRQLLDNAPLADLFRTDQTEYKWGNEIATPVGLITTGIDRLEQKVSTSTTYDRTRRSIDAVYAGLNGAHERHSWQVNARRDDNSQYGGFTTWGLGYGYAVLPSVRLHASRASSMKAPTFNDLYYMDSGNPNLRPERGHNNEVGVTWTQGAQQIKFTRFDNQVTDLITWADDGTGRDMWLPFNVDQARLKGWSLGWRAEMADWQLAVHYEHLDAFNGYGMRMTDRLPEHQASVSIDKQLGAWKVGGSALYVGQRTDRSGTVQLGSYTTLDAYAEYHINPTWSVQARVANLTDKVYETAYGYNQRGRTGYLTLKWTPR